uniref:Uncharacterized protein n=1 Tax=Kalanchoe fedtschenkoi TaxID=63787 RepID=A0A7N0TXR0_KALFE
MMKSARKKLKNLWARKKKKKSRYLEYNNGASSSEHHHCCRCSFSYPAYAQPSAPPLPSNWVDMEQTHEPTSPEFGLGYEELSIQEETANHKEILVKQSSRVDVPGTNIQAADNRISSSYQQYMVPNPVFGLPVSEKTVRCAKFFGFFFKFGSHLLSCFCPCLRIRD